MTKRKYTKKQRAQQEAETRERIVEATAALHGDAGPRNTTVSAIAERAGVQRLTVYRHFPDTDRLFEACTTHWLEHNPPPDPTAWQEIDDPAERTRSALAALYGYFRATAYMWARAHRDVDEVPSLQAPMAAFGQWLDGVRDDLLAAWGSQSDSRLRAVLGHAVRFTAWQSLDREGLDDAAMAASIVTWAAALAGSEGGHS